MLVECIAEVDDDALDGWLGGPWPGLLVLLAAILSLFGDSWGLPLLWLPCPLAMRCRWPDAELVARVL